jgi:hypothetical protein
MATSNIYFQNKQLEKFLLNLQAIAKLADSPIKLFKLYGKAISSLFLSKIYLFLFKTMLSFFSEVPTSQENGQRIYDTACQIRDFFVEGVHISHATFALLPFRRAIEKAAIDWDDFVEDYVVASDPELHNLLDQLTSHV